MSIARVTPGTAEEAASILREADGAGKLLRFVGGGTKLGWGRPPQGVEIEVSTLGLDGIIEHNASDLTAVVGAGTTLARAQEVLAGAGQMLALDPPDPDRRATIGGIVATGDSGPLRHRYGGPRDLLLGVRVALTDGSLARAGGKVIKNVAGYDLNRLFAGSFGTLGLIVEVVVRLNPLPSRRATVVGRSDDPLVIQRGAIALSRAPLELEALDLRWQERQGMLLARIAGVAPEERVESAVAIMRDAGLDAAAESNEEGAERSPGSGSDNGLGIWVAQRALQRSDGGAVVRVATVRSELARVLEVAGRLGASVAGRAGIGQLWVNFPRREDASVVAAIGELRASLSPRPCVVQDAPEPVRDNVDVWGEAGPLGLMRRIKERFDPHGVCNRGIFVGGI